MRNNDKHIKRFGVWYWTGPLILSVIITAGIRLVTDIPMGYKFWERPLIYNLIEWGSTLIIAFIFQEVLAYFLRRNNRDTNKLNIKKLLMEYFIIMILGIIIINPCIVIIHYFTNDPPGLDDFVIASVIVDLILIINYSFYRGGQILNAYIEQQLQTEKIRSMQMESELKYLKAQFRPHFLFNALNTIYFQIDENNTAPRETIEKLSDLLRYQLYDVNQMVTIEQEFKFIQTYIDMQKMRMKETLKLDFSFDPQLKKQQIHALLLFPLIENAFKYVGGDYWIRINAYLENETALVLKVENAIPANGNFLGNKGGIGLENLQRQLELLYPEKHKISTNKTSGMYTAILEIKLNNPDEYAGNNKVLA